MPTEAMPTHTVLRDYLWAALSRHQQRRAVVADGRVWTYAELAHQARAVAGHLAELGVGPGVPVALLLRNSVEYVVADLAIALVGAAKVPVNLMLSTAEQAYILADSGSRVCVVDHDGTAALSGAVELGASPVAVVVGGSADTWGSALDHAPLVDPPSFPPETLGLIMYTGGTTGRPKGVQHTQRGLASNLLSHVIEMEIVADDSLLLTSPLPHSAGFLLQAALVKGAVAFVEDRFDVETVIDRIGVDRASYLFLVPTMIYRLLDAIDERRDDVDLGSIRTILYGAAPITIDRLEQGLSRFGKVFIQLYAQSEAPNFLTRLRRDDHRLDKHTHRLRSCGQSVLMADVVVRREDGAPCEAEEVGEVTARSPYTMVGYRNRDAETAEALRNGWLYTGDLGYLDEDGYLYLVDRKKYRLITGGLNVYSSEVEQALARMPEIREVAVTGVPHDDWGEAVVAFVVPANDDLTVDSIGVFARATLTTYKRPKHIEIVPRLPVTAVGKIDKKTLRESWTLR